MLFMVLLCAGCRGTTADDRPNDARDAGAKQSADAGRASSKGDAGAPVVDGGRGDREQDAATATRTCDENAGRAKPSWRRITTGLDDFRLSWDHSDGISRVDAGARGIAGVAYGNDVFVIVGGGYSGDGLIHFATSDDGVEWEPGSTPIAGGDLGTISRVFFARGQFLFAAERDGHSNAPTLVLYSSTDGRTWGTSDLPAEIPFVFDLASSDTLTVLAGGDLWSSSDLVTWSQHSFDTGNPRSGVSTVELGAGRWITRASWGTVVDGRRVESTQGYGSSDGLDWQPISVFGTATFGSDYEDGLWIATTGEDYFTSRDAQTFIEVEPSGLWNEIAASDRTVRTAGGRFFTFSVDRSQVPPSQVRVVHTLDGTRWDDFGEVPGLALPEGAIDVEYELNDIAYGDCRDVVAGAYTVTVPGALDPPPFASEIGPWLMVADVATP